MTPVAALEQVSPPLSAYGPARSTISGTPLHADELRKTHAYWRACNYLVLGMIYHRHLPGLATRYRRVANSPRNSGPSL